MDTAFFCLVPVFDLAPVFDAELSRHPVVEGANVVPAGHQHASEAGGTRVHGETFGELRA
jgi:hypothetical protein